jgi:hypothetical protein
MIARDHLRDLGVNGKTVLKYTLKVSHQYKTGEIKTLNVF